MTTIESVGEVCHNPFFFLSKLFISELSGSIRIHMYKICEKSLGTYFFGPLKGLGGQSLADKSAEKSSFLSLLLLFIIIDIIDICGSTVWRADKDFKFNNRVELHRFVIYNTQNMNYS